MLLWIFYSDTPKTVKFYIIGNMFVFTLWMFFLEKEIFEWLYKFNESRIVIYSYYFFRLWVERFKDLSLFFLSFSPILSEKSLISYLLMLVFPWAFCCLWSAASLKHLGHIFPFILVDVNFLVLIFSSSS